MPVRSALNCSFSVSEMLGVILTGLEGVLGQAGLLMLSLSSPWYEDRLAGLGVRAEGVGGSEPH